MTTTVRLFTYSGLYNPPLTGGTQLTLDSVLMYKQPYLGSAKLSCTDVSPASSDPTVAPQRTSIALMQVQSGKRVFYEVNTTGRSVAASSNSPTGEGNVTLEFGAGYSVSVLECGE